MSFKLHNHHAPTYLASVLHLPRQYFRMYGKLHMQIIRIYVQLLNIISRPAPTSHGEYGILAESEAEKWRM